LVAPDQFDKGIAFQNAINSLEKNIPGNKKEQYKAFIKNLYIEEILVEDEYLNCIPIE